MQRSYLHSRSQWALALFWDHPAKWCSRRRSSRGRSRDFSCSGAIRDAWRGFQARNLGRPAKNQIRWSSCRELAVWISHTCSVWWQILSVLVPVGQFSNQGTASHTIQGSYSMVLWLSYVCLRFRLTGGFLQQGTHSQAHGSCPWDHSGWKRELFHLQCRLSTTGSQPCPIRMEIRRVIDGLHLGAARPSPLKP